MYRTHRRSLAPSDITRVTRYDGRPDDQDCLPTGTDPASRTPTDRADRLELDDEIELELEPFAPGIRPANVSCTCSTPMSSANSESGAVTPASTSGLPTRWFEQHVLTGFAERIHPLDLAGSLRQSCEAGRGSGGSWSAESYIEPRRPGERSATERVWFHSWHFAGGEAGQVDAAGGLSAP
jgi:hypothetical protein